MKCDGSLQELSSHGLPLALFPGKPYGSSRFTLGAGDLLCLYTDGVTEANSPDGTEFGFPRLKEFLGGQVGRMPLEIEDSLLKELEEHAQGEPFADDFDPGSAGAVDGNPGKPLEKTLDRLNVEVDLRGLVVHRDDQSRSDCREQGG